MVSFIQQGLAALAILWSSSVASAHHLTPSSQPLWAHEYRRRNEAFDVFHPPVNYKTSASSGLAEDLTLVKRNTFDTIEEYHRATVAHELGMHVGDVRHVSGYSSDVANYTYFQQLHDNLPIFNAVANVASVGDEITSLGTAFVKADKPTSSVPTLEFAGAFSQSGVEQKFGGASGYVNVRKGASGTLGYIARRDGTLSLVYGADVSNEAERTMHRVFIDAHTGNVISAVNYAADASYKVIPAIQLSPESGFQVIVNPQDSVASPNGWHKFAPNYTFTDTRGNNGVVYISYLTPLLAQETSSPLNFIYNFTASQPDPLAGQNGYASIVNAFYMINVMHDISYRYGFCEAAFNFQQDNFEKGGKGQDGIQAMIHYTPPEWPTSAQMVTPPDGQTGFLDLGIFQTVNPNRAVPLQNDIIIHEYAHGITNRMIGGGTAACLQTRNARALGEGLSDAFADWMWQQGNRGVIQDFVFGAWASGKSRGVRKYPYSTDVKVNPLTYGSLKGLTNEHDMGEVWAEILHNVHAALVKSLGFTSYALTDPSTTHGNVVFMRIFIDALAKMPCNPGFIQARDAWIQAEENRYKRKYRCALWKAFAARGLGFKATGLFADDKSLPADCSELGWCDLNLAFNVQLEPTSCSMRYLKAPDRAAGE